MNEKKADITNFIGVYDNYITKQQCDEVIKLYEDQDKFNKTIDRFLNEKSSITQKKDQQFFASDRNIDVWWESAKTMLFNFDIAWKHYNANVGAEDSYDGNPFNYTTLKIQKTLPTEGYHVWHIEHGRGFDLTTRAFVFSIYLNDVEEGGETEFLHFSRRVKPKTGRIVIWPAGFPYLHRGNPPLSGEKYIVTSWMILKP
jgi:hypothetical protein